MKTPNMYLFFLEWSNSVRKPMKLFWPQAVPPKVHPDITSSKLYEFIQVTVATTDGYRKRPPH